MTWLWLLPVLLVLTLTLLFLPVFQRTGNRPMAAGLEGDPRALLEDQRELLLRQIKEMDYDVAAGALQPESAASLRSGLEKELIQVLAGLDALQPDHPDAIDSTRQGRAVDVASGIAIMLTITLLVSGTYYVLGTPVPPAATGHGPQGAAGELQQMVEGLAQRLRNEPDNLEGWLRLGRSYAVMGRIPEALTAYTHVLSRQPDNLDAAVAVAALQMRSQDPEAVRLGLEMFESILAKNPDQPDALWYTGINAYNAGNTTRALTLWRHLRELMPANSKGRQTVEEAIQEAENTPITPGQ